MAEKTEVIDPDPPEGWIREYSPKLKIRPDLTRLTQDVFYSKGTMSVEVWDDIDGGWWCGAYGLITVIPSKEEIDCGERSKAIETAHLLMERENAL